MKITNITIQKSKTINLTGISGRTQYQKLSVSMTADLNEDDQYLDCYTQLSCVVDDAIKQELSNLKANLIEKK